MASRTRQVNVARTGALRVRAEFRYRVARSDVIPADWELRVGDYRIFYDVDDGASIVGIVNVGYKPRETLYVAGTPIADADSAST